MSIDDYFGDWLSFINKKELNSILEFLSKEYATKSICPNQSEIFKCFRLCSLSELTIVILGQDPYPQKGVATGIAFGNKRETSDEKLSPSLKIIKKSIENLESKNKSSTFDITLENWEKQGILMLNTSLTVEENKIGSHTMLWRKFLIELLGKLSRQKSRIIYAMFGEQAKTFKPYMDFKQNLCLEEKHPAYYARLGKDMPSTIFKQIDRYMEVLYDFTITW